MCNSCKKQKYRLARLDFNKSLHSLKRACKKYGVKSILETQSKKDEVYSVKQKFITSSQKLRKTTITLENDNGDGN